MRRIERLSKEVSDNFLTTLKKGHEYGDFDEAYKCLRQAINKAFRNSEQFIHPDNSIADVTEHIYNLVEDYAYAFATDLNTLCIIRNYCFEGEPYTDNKRDFVNIKELLAPNELYLYKTSYSFRKEIDAKYFKRIENKQILKDIIKQSISRYM